MSNERHETIDDIVKEMRKRAEEVYAGQDGYPESYKDQMDDDEIREIADRIETAYRRFYDKYKEHTDELNRQILILKHEKEMSTMYFCGYDPEEALVAQCSTCRFFQRKHSYCTLNDSLTNVRYKCTGWTFKTNKELADEYKSKLNREVEELRKENTLLRASLKPVLDIVMDSATSDLSMEMAIKEAKRVYWSSSAKGKGGD